ncbi:type IV pilus secretin PilQ [Marinibactrum halimedae]|uniref:Fimbrial assembly protein PilQ n=1 Tax=Marinibactrum halimedae TaxID=1444977 RepID=A0AA37WMT7_9GAMM|nr:type IV pilus secretin PilQ [Marinibactrum halimedae]MCD9459741.1 type IV pilus secretin PilQ [Marinibactrum halimedae]GLS24502.1 fimbrial assembly protein PilQ [Marinibactrum halimedae]
MYKTIRAYLLRCVVVGLPALMAGVVHAQSITLDNIDFSSLPGDKFEVELQFSESPAEPVGYIIEQPARIVLDFPNVESQLPEKKYPLSFGNAQSAVVLTADNRTRLILNLDEAAAYTTRFDGSKYVVVVGGAPSGSVSTVAEASNNAAVASPPSTPSYAYSSQEPTVTNVDFRRTETGEGRVIIELSSSSVNVDVEETASSINVSFIDVALPSELRRRLDVTDFATPVSFIDTDNRGGVTTVSIDPEGEYEYLAYQADLQYVISVKPLSVQEQEERRSKFEYVGDKLSLNFQDIEVRAVLQLIADFTDLNLVASDTVSGRITLRLENVPWDQALDIVLKAKGLDKRQIGNVLMVAPAAEIANRERQELETRKQLEELAPLRTEHVRVRYANAIELFELFRDQNNQGGGQGRGGAAGGASGSTSTGSILSERGSVIVDERTNSIILTDTEEKIQEFKRLVEQIDIPIRQVLIEARIVTASADFARQLGVEWSSATLDVNDDSVGFAGGNLAGDLQFDSGTLSGDFGVVDLGVAGAAADIAFGYITDDSLIGLELSALESEGTGEIISQPKVVTGDKQTATIRSGSEIPYQEASASGATTTAYREATLKLEVTPQITPDDHIILDLAVNQDAIGENVLLGTGAAPTIDITEVITQVLVKNGETIVLGGIFQSVESVTERKVPLLGDIPYVGRLFKNDSRDTEKNELLIFITPKLLEDPVRR